MDGCRVRGTTITVLNVETVNSTCRPLHKMVQHVVNYTSKIESLLDIVTASRIFRQYNPRAIRFTPSPNSPAMPSIHFSADWSAYKPMASRLGEYDLLS